MKKSRRIRFIALAAILITAGISISFLATQETRDFRIAKNLDIFFSLYRELNTFYVDELNPDKLVKTGIDNMLKSLDPYTVYYPESESDEIAFMTTGKYGGIGSLIRGGGEYVVISLVYKGFPADLAGVRAGDLIKKVDGFALKGADTETVSQKLKGNPGTTVMLTIERNGKEMEIPVKREKIEIPSVPYYGMIDNETGYIRFTNFTQNCSEDVRNALIKLKNEKATKIILDLRSNPGGLLTEAVNVVNLFVGPGNEIVSTKGKVKQFDESFKTSKAAVDQNIPLAVIINRGSASASEIVAGAIQDLDRGVVVGQRSYGKGLVQITRPLSYNSQLKVTTAKYYIPSGRCIQALDFSNPNEDGSVGIIPDSLISEFRTRNGRVVRDGGGISPDVEALPSPLSQIAAELYQRNYFFDFATKYFWSHPAPESPMKFTISEEIYDDFRNYLVEREFNYSTITELSLNELISNAKREKYYELHKDLFTELQNELRHTLDNDLVTFRDEITELLADEIIGRYFYEEGSIQFSLGTDVQVKKAVEILKSADEYKSILQGRAGSILISHEDNVIMPGLRYDHDKGDEKNV
ncbi:MAG: S41 family peptidase [Bacteroidales bacterium]|jgi:carboxyl-terminal processing protease|nr:S41 family peptidase [Bacteroidales bacterium]MDI9553630.1 S41 family peptidase [Bacteroidota bacterium]MZP66280.1 PDZ domain-containing protein [Bacteroidales bacterium]NLK55326.1 S41 family peptidase [Bacteroidales bacterium]HPB13019.1 S41 family peptidase [Bacteroidales bacterium]